MQKKEETHIRIDGAINKLLPKGEFEVKLVNGHIITAHISGKIRMNFIRVLIGDRVIVEVSPYDLKRGRIVYRY